MRMKTVLFVTYYFPPSGGSKTRRTLKFLKYLGHYGWTPVVLTSAGGRQTSYDPLSLDQVPKHVRVYKALTPAAWLRQFMPRRSSERAEDAHRGAASQGQRRTPFWKRYFGNLLSYFVIPDAFIVWTPAAVYRGIKLLNTGMAEVIYTTGPPFSNFLIAVLLKKITRRPLVIDFRDAWIAEPAQAVRQRPGRLAIESFLERMAIRQADVVLAATEGVTQDFRQRYPTAFSSKFTTLSNGFDRDEFAAIRRRESRPSSDKFRIVHTGHLRSERSPRTFLQALRQLFDQVPDVENHVEVYLVGENRPFNDGHTIDDYLQMYRLQHIVHLTGHVASADAINYQLEADLLLLIIGVVPENQASTYGVASKVFDYMVAEKPILTLAGKGQVSQLIDETGIGETIEPANIDAIQDYLWRAYERYQRGERGIDARASGIDQYDCRELTKQLAALLDQLLGSSSHAPQEVSTNVL